MLLSLAATSVSADAQVYRWTDENGVTHYGSRAPDRYRSQPITVEPQRRNGARLASPEQIERAGRTDERDDQPNRAQVRQREAEARARRERLRQERRCDRWQQKLAELETFMAEAYNTRDGRKADNLRQLLKQECR